MGKSKTNDRYKVNFANPKTKMVVSTMLLGESRITRGEILSMGNKEILYSLIHSGYIKEREKGVYIPTPKLKSHVAKDTRSFSSSKSEEHSRTLRESLSLAPKDVLLDGRFKTSTEIEHHFKRDNPSQEKDYLFPDYQLTLTQHEMERYIESLVDYRDTFAPYSRAYSLIDESITKLQALTPQDITTINIEIVTNHYGNRELEMHRSYEQITNVPQIFLM